MSGSVITRKNDVVISSLYTNFQPLILRMQDKIILRRLFLAGTRNARISSGQAQGTGRGDLSHWNNQLTDCRAVLQ
jgi:hypothetical protein